MDTVTNNFEFKVGMKVDGTYHNLATFEYEDDAKLFLKAIKEEYKNNVFYLETSTGRIWE